MNKIVLLLFITLIAISSITLLVLFYVRITTKTPVSTRPSPAPSPTITPAELPKNPTIKSSGVEIKNPYTSPKQLTPQGDVLFEDSSIYHISYLKQFDQFLITILQEPFETNRQLAENKFISTLGISKTQACQLKVRVSPPEKQGELTPSYKLSFCE